MKKILVLVLALIMACSCVRVASAEETVKITYFGNNALSGSGEQGASLSGMVRCAQIENFVGQQGFQEGLR